jgi:hypothetical protein
MDPIPQGGFEYYMKLDHARGPEDVSIVLSGPFGDHPTFFTYEAYGTLGIINEIGPRGFVYLSINYPNRFLTRIRIIPQANRLVSLIKPKRIAVSDSRKVNEAIGLVQAYLYIWITSFPGMVLQKTPAGQPSIWLIPNTDPNLTLIEHNRQKITVGCYLQLKHLDTREPSMRTMGLPPGGDQQGPQTDLLAATIAKGVEQGVKASVKEIKSGLEGVLNSFVFAVASDLTALRTRAEGTESNIKQLSEELLKLARELYKDRTEEGKSLAQTLERMATLIAATQNQVGAALRVAGDNTAAVAQLIAQQKTLLDGLAAGFSSKEPTDS